MLRRIERGVFKRDRPVRRGQAEADMRVGERMGSHVSLRRKNILAGAGEVSDAGSGPAGKIWKPRTTVLFIAGIGLVFWGSVFYLIFD